MGLYLQSLGKNNQTSKTISPRGFFLDLLSESWENLSMQSENQNKV
ncbi:MAG: hypothetical protein KPI85_02600 [cyanobacterium endosymbiont of Epithemia adnata isolate EadnSB Bon19]|jgi:hypothetical protein